MVLVYGMLTEMSTVQHQAIFSFQKYEFVAWVIWQQCVTGAVI